MVRIWAKIITDQKIQRDFVYEKAVKFDYADMFGYLADICDALDIPTPVFLKSHLLNYAKFHHVRFRPSDFIESVDFDMLWLENA